METLVIHPKDVTTDFLYEIYRDKGFDVITYFVPQHELKTIIKDYDRIMMMGHGSPNGLFGKYSMTIDSSFVDVLKDKYCVCIWCNADAFVKQHGIKGFYSGMVISEVDEAYYYSINATQEQVDESNKLFAKAIRNSFNVDEIKQIYKTNNNPVIKFNEQRLYHT
jgi:hypothetical protein